MNTSLSILFMDDEPSNDIISNARERLSAQGFEVDFVSTMSAAIEAYYEKFYDIFILDIDMSHLADDQEGDGVKVLKRFVSLHNQTKVILFSGAGTVQHWFAAANAHCFGYIAKDQQQGELDSIDLLIEKIKTTINTPVTTKNKTSLPPPSKVLLISDDAELSELSSTLVNKTLGDNWSTQIMTPEQWAENPPSNDQYGIIACLQARFSTRARVQHQLATLLASTPSPQTIIACDGLDAERNSILFIANHHPFRMVDLQHPQWQQFFTDTLMAAVNWYGKQEIFVADADTLSRIHITLPEDVQANWDAELSDEEMERLYDDYETAIEENDKQDKGENL